MKELAALSSDKTRLQVRGQRPPMWPPAADASAPPFISQTAAFEKQGGPYSVLQMGSS